MAMRYRPNGRVVPANIKCTNCGKFKPQNSYASNRLDKLRRTGGINANTHIMCIPCTPNNAPTELKCYHCDKVKVISDFAKAQRAKDEPECEVCTNERTNMEPGRSESDQGPEYSDGEDSPWEHDFDAPTEPVTVPGVSARSLANSGGVNLSDPSASSKPTTNTHPRTGASTTAAAPSSATSVTSRTTTSTKTTGRSVWKESKPPKSTISAEPSNKPAAQQDFAARQFDDSDSED